MSSHSSIRRQPSMITDSTFISTQDVLVGDGLVGLEGEVAVGPAEEVEGDVFDLVAHRLLERGPVDVAVLQEDGADASLGRLLLLLGERRPQLLARDVARLHEALAERHRARVGRGEVDLPVAEEDLARLALAVDRQRSRLGAHLDELKDVRQVEFLEVSLQEHSRSPRMRPCDPPPLPGGGPSPTFPSSADGGGWLMPEAERFFIYYWRTRPRRCNCRRPVRTATGGPDACVHAHRHDPAARSGGGRRRCWPRSLSEAGWRLDVRRLDQADEVPTGLSGGLTR